MKNSLRYAGARGPLLLAIMTVAFVLGASFILVMVAPARAQDGAAVGYYLTVQDGDSWGTVAAETGLSVADLKAANPDAVRDNDWLLVGEQIFVPYPQSTTEKVHVVKAGESWNSIADNYDVSVGLLQAVNSNAIRPGLILFKGEELVIPTPGAVAPTATATDSEPEADATSVATEVATATQAAQTGAEIKETVVVEEAPAAGTPVATLEPSATPTAGIVITITDVGSPIGQSNEISATEEVTSSSAVTATDTMTDSLGGTEVATDTVTIDLPACPAKFTEYPALMAEIVSQGPSGISNLSAFLGTCGALVEDAYVTSDFTGDGQDDLVVVYQNPNQESAFIEADMIIFNSSADGLVQAYRARAAGEVRLLATSDINLDEMPDVVWVDTTCGASTCFDTVNVRSWDGTEWTDWTDGTITMAYAEIGLSDSLEDGAGEEITLSGGIYGSVGAGPQRSRAEVWASQGGGPYTLVEKIYNPSDCLYHSVLDANRAFLDGPADSFADARALYQQAATNASLIKCWVRNNELEELRSFSLFRLAVIAGYQDAADVAATQVDTLVESYPSSIFAQVADLWLESYTESGSAAAACVAVTAYAEENPATWEVLADYGYTNPSFEAADVCPLLDLSGVENGDGAQGSAASAPIVNFEEMDAASLELAAFPACPGDLAGFEELIPSLLIKAEGDAIKLDNWMRLCTVLSGSSGALARADLNDDGIPDFLFFPSVLSDSGLGPNGAQGAVLIYHSRVSPVDDVDAGRSSDASNLNSANTDAANTDAANTDAANTSAIKIDSRDNSAIKSVVANSDVVERVDYVLTASPVVYGQAAPLAVDDLNLDGRMDIAWTVEACSTFCLSEVEMWTWDGDAYVALIRPGAVIANGVAFFEPAPDGEPGDGQQLVLYGGISGTPEGGLEVAHWERWQSQDAGLYQRVEWQYNRDFADQDCMGLRIVEADVALQAAPMIGYGPAIERYRAALDPALEACSIFGLPAGEEVALLQGLGSFRLTQAYALNGDLDMARKMRDAVEVGQRDSDYAKMAATWLADYLASGDPYTACAKVSSILEQNRDLWQISDHYGYNHPVMPPDAVCFTP